MEKPLYLPETGCIPNLPKQSVGQFLLLSVPELVSSLTAFSWDASGKIVFDREFL